MPGRFWGSLTSSEIPELAAAILDPARTRPIVVVTTPGYTTADRIPDDVLREAETIVQEIGDIADVAIVATGEVSYTLEDLLPPKWHIFNGYCRSYPTGILANPEIHRSPLRHRRGNEVASEQVINDALGHALEAGAFEGVAKGRVTVTGRVLGFLFDGEQALIDVGATMPAVLWRDATIPGVPLDWVLAKDGEVRGEWDRERNRFIVRKTHFGVADLLSEIPHGAVTLALVDSVEPDRAVLRVHPDIPITIHRSDVSPNPHDLLDLFVIEGEVVRVRMIHLSTGTPHLRLSDIEDDEPVVAPVAVLEGGIPWLVEGRGMLPDAPAARHADAIGAPAAGVTTEALDTATDAIRPPAPSAASEPAAPRSAAPEAAAPQPARPRPAPPRPGPGFGLRSRAASGTGPVPPAESAPTASAPVPTSPEPARELPAAGTPVAETIEATAGRSGAVRSMSIRIDELTAQNRVLRRSADEAESLRHELELTKRRLRDVRVEFGEALRTIDHLRGRLRASVREMRKARRSTRVAPEGGDRASRRDDWADLSDWLRHEIRIAWVGRVPAYEKRLYPLPADYDIGPDLAPSLEALDDGQFDKAMKCIVDVLTDRAKDIPGRDLHPLRSGPGGSDPQRVRKDGARAWRAAIENDAASARRLHYWVLPGGRIELARVGIHDDMTA